MLSGNTLGSRCHLSALTIDRTAEVQAASWSAILPDPHRILRHTKKPRKLIDLDAGPLKRCAQVRADGMPTVIQIALGEVSRNTRTKGQSVHAPDIVSELYFIRHFVHFGLATNIPVRTIPTRPITVAAVLPTIKLRIEGSISF